MKATILPIIGALILLGCKKKMDISSMHSCHIAQQLDSAGTAWKLLGNWKWEKRDCPGTNQTSPADKNVYAYFQDSVFTVKQDTTTLTYGTWKLVQLGSNIYQLEMYPPNLYLYGQILFCEDEVLFNDSYRDGCDHLFGKNQDAAQGGRIASREYLISFYIQQRTGHRL